MTDAASLETVDAVLTASAQELRRLKHEIALLKPLTVNERRARGFTRAITKIQQDVGGDLKWSSEWFQTSPDLAAAIQDAWSKGQACNAQASLCLSQSETLYAIKQWFAGVVAACCGLNALIEQTAQLQQVHRILVASAEAQRQARTRSLLHLPNGLTPG